MKVTNTLTRILILAFALLSGCQVSNQSATEQWKKEILETEQAFSDMTAREGIPKAFETFAADNVVLNRNDSLIFGKTGLQQFYNKQSDNDLKISLSWKPDFVDVSSSGDLGYTYGTYVYTVTDSLGKMNKYTGIFHTVWKRQANGMWRFVWD